MKDDDESTTPQTTIMAEAEKLYQKREIEYPVDYAMEMTAMLMHNPADCKRARTTRRMGQPPIPPRLEARRVQDGPAESQGRALRRKQEVRGRTRNRKEVAKGQATKSDDELDALLQRSLQRGHLRCPASPRR